MFNIEKVETIDIATSMRRNGWFGDTTNINDNIGFNEFSLDDLGIDFERVKDSVFQTQKEVGLFGWRTRGNVVKDYTGFSVTRNPKYKGDSPTPWHQTFGDKSTTGTFSHTENSESFQEERNTYFDTYAFNEVHPNFHWLTNKFTGAILRSRCAYAWSKHMEFPYRGGWHIDEPAWAMLRFVVPITTGDNWRIEFEEEIYQLDLGKAYVWNNRIPHRVAPTHPGNDPRINLILGFSPWFYFEEGYFMKNEVYGMDLNKLVKEKKFLKDFL